jgi:hypothetical protein
MPLQHLILMPETFSLVLTCIQNSSPEESCLPDPPLNQNSFAKTFPLHGNMDWNHNFTIRGCHPTNTLQFAAAPLDIWNCNATSHQYQPIYTPLPWVSPSSTWNAEDTSLDYQNSTPLTETPFTSFNTTNTANIPAVTQTPYLSPGLSGYCPSSQTNNIIPHSPPADRFLDMAYFSSQPSPSTLSPASTTSAASLSTDYKSPKQSTTDPKTKTQSCSNCHLAFARVADLERHKHTIHLRIRHHCNMPGCLDNAGKGYCRREKLRKHLRTVHGTA